MFFQKYSIDLKRITFCSLFVILVQRTFGQNITDHYSDNITINCTQHYELCLKHNLTCNYVTEHCQCPIESPVYLSSEIPCLSYKNLDDICLHTLQCNLVKNAICVATFLFPVEITSTPTYKQWFFYNQIKVNDDINFLLNKMYGRCRCKDGYRAVNRNTCSYVGRQISLMCNYSTDCPQENSHCDILTSYCRCLPGFYYDQQWNQCQSMHTLHGQYCISSADCLMSNTSMDCINSQCSCIVGYHFKNDTGCVRNKQCSRGYKWNNTNYECQPMFIGSCPLCPFVIKLFLIILIKIAFFNIIRHICTERSRRIHSHSISHQLPLPNMRRYRNIDYGNIHQINIQSSSLLSLPDYDTIIDQNSNCDEERLPSYEEAVLSLNISTSMCENPERKVS